MVAARFPIIVAVVLLLGGCAAQPKVPFDKSVAEVKTIGVVTPKNPDQASVYLASSVGRSFGLIGAVIDAGMQANRESQFKTILSERKAAPTETFMASLTRSLEAQGYTVKQVPVARSGSDFLEKYPPAGESGVDAYLDLVTSYGYIAAGIQASAPWRPFYYTRTRLVHAKDSKVLMQDVVAYNPIAPYVANAVTVPPQPEYHFADFDGLVANAPKAVQGLDAAAEQLAKTVSSLIQ
jgi:hypothetical protein